MEFLRLLCWPKAIVGSLIQRAVKTLVAPIKSFRWGLVGKTISLAMLIQLLFFLIPIPNEPIFKFNGFRKMPIGC